MFYSQNAKNSNSIDRIIQILSKIPGFGQRSAFRAVYYLLSHKDKSLIPLFNELNHLVNHAQFCQKCHNIAFDTLCTICNDTKRDKTAICIVEKPQDIHVIEKANFYRGTYYVIGGLLSAFNGITPNDLKIDVLLSHIEQDIVTEIIFALPATQDGRTTLHYISDRIAHYNIKITMPAQGIPLGSDLDFIDQGTMTTAFRSRINIG